MKNPYYLYVLLFKNCKSSIDSIFNWCDRSDWKLENDEIPFAFLGNDLLLFLNSAHPFNPSYENEPEKLTLTGKGSFATDIAIQSKINEFFVIDLEKNVEYLLSYYENFGLPNQERVMACIAHPIEKKIVDHIIKVVEENLFDGSYEF